MLLSDRDLLPLPEMTFETDEPERPFSPETQVQPCSIDLRLDRCSWVTRVPLLGRSIDLRQPGAGEADMMRSLSGSCIRDGEGFTLRPGEMVLARTFEKFTIPNGYGGKLEGRSSFARLGLSIHCTGDFINPRWRGRMPLQLVNHGKVPIILTPYIQISQLLVVCATSISERPYGDRDAGHKYVDDDGGPSRYWLDNSLRKLQQAFGQHHLPGAMQSEFLGAFGSVDPERMDRFSDFISTLGPAELASSREVMERFADYDVRRHKFARAGFLLLRWIGLALVTVSLGAIFKSPYGWLHICLWAVTIALFPFGIYANFVGVEPSAPFSARRGRTFSQTKLANDDHVETFFLLSRFPRCALNRGWRMPSRTTTPIKSSMGRRTSR